MSQVVVITPPASSIDMRAAKSHLRVDSDDDDLLISVLIDAAVANLDGPAGWLGRCLGVQTLELRLEGFWNYRSGHNANWGEQGRGFWSRCGSVHYRSIDLPCPPVREIVSVTYADINGIDQTVNSAIYALKDGALCLASGVSWPVCREGPDSVRVRYTAGYDRVPAPIQAAVLLMVGSLYENRSGTMMQAGPASVIVNPAVQDLLLPFRVWGA